MIRQIATKITMQTISKANVLVIDDDEVVLVAVADLLEEAGYRVVTQQSPIGATQVMVRENIDAAIIDINLPVIQGDSVVRLLQTWDRVKEIPIVIISGVAPEQMAALQRELPQTRFVPKARLEQRLVTTLDELITMRSRRSRTSLTPVDTSQGGELVPLFTKRLAAELNTGHQSWRKTCAGDALARIKLSRSLLTLRGQAQLLGLERPAQLLQALSAVVDAMEGVAQPPPGVDSAVESSLAALLSLERSLTADFALSPEPLQRRLSDAVIELAPLRR